MVRTRGRDGSIIRCGGPYRTSHSSSPSSSMPSLSPFIYPIFVLAFIYSILIDFVIQPPNIYFIFTSPPDTSPPYFAAQPLSYAGTPHQGLPDQCIILMIQSTTPPLFLLVITVRVHHSTLPQLPLCNPLLLLLYKPLLLLLYNTPLLRLYRLPFLPSCNSLLLSSCKTPLIP